MPQARIAVIGGSGFYQIESLTEIEQVEVQTPFGPPSDKIVIGTLEGERVAFLPRHGVGHRFMPTDVPYQANIFALKSLGVEHIIAVSACGSMREDLAPLHIVIPDQLFDRTRQRRSTFFGDGLVVHVGMANPFCPDLSATLFEAARQVSTTVHRGGTYVCIEGPQFSTKAESRIYRQWGVDVIGMTALPEARLAREAEICYACVALVTDYDVWYESEEPVTVEMVVANLLKNVVTAKSLIRAAIPQITRERHCECAHALASAIITTRESIPAETRAKLDLLIGRYLK